MTEVSGLSARRAALRMIDAVMRRGESLDRARHGACQGMSEPSDRALAIAIAGEVLRHMPGLDDLIDSATRQRLPDDAKARTVLRIALAQTLRLGTPPHAAIATSLPLLEGGPRRLVHGVLGTLLRGKAELPPARLPEPAASRWHSAWGDTAAEAAGAALAAPPPLDVSLRNAADTAHWAEALPGVSLMPGHVRMARAGSVEALPGFGEGAWWVQDLAASLPARLLGQGEGRAVLDLCAAPGGKTLQLAAAGWQVTAVDAVAKRLAMVSEGLARTGLAAETLAEDLLDWEPQALRDAVLLDAPCSATGIFRRHPDVLYRIGRDAIAERADLQGRLLDRAAHWVKPGGMLVYAVCSLEPEEGEAQITAFLTRQPGLTIDPVHQSELPEGVAPAKEGWVRTLPGMLAEQGGLDGFFMARMRRAF